MKCPSCNRETNDNGKFCTFCGAKLPAIKYCPKCGASLSQNKKFCEKCGTPNPYFEATSDLTTHSQNNNVSDKTQPSYPVYSQPVNANTVGLGQPNQQGQNVTPAFGNAAPQTGYQNSIQSVSEIQDEVVPEAKQQTENAIQDSTSQNSTNTSEEKVNDKDRNNDIPASHDDKNSTSKDLDDVELPVYEELEHRGSATLWVTIIIVLILIAGGVLLGGQRLNWWNIEMLSWVNGNNDSNNISDANTPSGLDSANSWQEQSKPCLLTLSGYADGKYPVEMILTGEIKGDGVYVTECKYRSTKKKVWTETVCKTEKVVGAISYIKILGYDDGKLTGTWNVRYNMEEETLIGDLMTPKGDEYKVYLKNASELNGESLSDNKSEQETDHPVSSSDVNTKTTFSMTLSGKVDGKYVVEMFIKGYKTPEGIYPESGKYRYAKYKGAWIELYFEINKANEFKIFEYTDGNLTGTWDVYFDPYRDRLLGYMTNYKGDTYSIDLKEE